MLFAIGSPGQPARIIWQARDIEDATSQLLLDEVAVAVPTVGAYVIAEDGQTASVAEPSLDDLWFEIRVRRQGLLTNCDWTQSSDVPEATRTAWVGYRQALRDITETFSDPAAVVWPTAPDATL